MLIKDLKLSLCFWGYGPGCPFDGIYSLKEIRFSDSVLYLRFEENEECSIYCPKNIISANNRFEIRDAKKIIWTFYPYGEPQINKYSYECYMTDDGKVRIIDQYSNTDKTISAEENIPFVGSGYDSRKIAEILMLETSKSPSLTDQINYIKEKAELLANSNSPECDLAVTLGDYLTDDIANDWIAEDVTFLEEMQALGIIDHNVIALYKKISLNFESACDDASVWKSEALFEHPFWIKQRRLAKKMLAELELKYEFDLELKNKIVYSFPLCESPVRRSLCSGLEFHDIEKNIYLVFLNGTVDKLNINDFSDAIKENINKFIVDQRKTVIAVGYTDDSFEKKDLIFFDSKDTLIVFYLINKDSKEVFMNNSQTVALESNHAKILNKIDEMVQSEI